MTALAQDQANSGSSVSSVAVTISSAAGSTLVAVISGYITGSTPFNLSSVTDTAGNTWTYSTAAGSQNPPASGSYDSTRGDYGLCAIACCIGARAVTSVTFTFSATVGFAGIAVLEFSGLPAGSQVLAAASAGIDSSGTSYTTPSVTTATASLAIACTSCFGSFSSVSSGWTIEPNSDTAAYSLAAPPGLVSCTLTSGSTQRTPSSAILAIGAAAAAPYSLLIPPSPFSPMSWQHQARPSSAPLLVTQAETGTGTDAATAGIPVGDSDAGSGTDIGLREFSGADTGAGAEAASVTATVPGADTGSGADTGTAIVPVAASDAGAGAEGLAGVTVRPLLRARWNAPGKVSLSGGTMRP
jgi:hypothetical protein